MDCAKYYLPNNSAVLKSKIAGVDWSQRPNAGSFLPMYLNHFNAVYHGISGRVHIET